MRPDTTLDYALFQLSPKRSRCELFVSGDGQTEKLASGLLKPFVTHLTVAEDQVAREVPSIKLEVNKRKNERSWFTKGTLERFVRFVSTPEVLELVIRIDGEMSQLEAARKIYLQGAGDQISNATGGDVAGASTSADITKKELLRAIDVRLVAVRQDLSTACSRASAAGFTIDTISDLQLFADRFGAHRLNEACAKFIALSKKRRDLISTWKVQGDNQVVRSSFESDMSIDDQSEETIPARTELHQQTTQEKSEEQDSSRDQVSTEERARQHSQREASCERDERKDTDETVLTKEPPALSESPQMTRAARRLSVQDRINLFENKQKEQTTSSGSKVVSGKPTELRRLSSDVSTSSQSVEKAVLRRWSGASDMSMDLSNEKKETESSASTPCSTSNSFNQTIIYPSALLGKDNKVLNDTATSSMTTFRVSKEEKDTETSAATPGSASNFSNLTSTEPSAPLVKESTVLKDAATSSITNLKGSGDELHSQMTLQHISNFQTKDPAAYQQKKDSEDDVLVNQPRWSSFPEKSEGIEKKDLMFSQMPVGGLSSRVESSGRQEMKLQKRNSSEKSQFLHGKRGDSGSILVNGGPLASSGKVLATSEVSDCSTTIVEQVQKGRQSKGNQELNDELQIKANDLEKLFAAHKLRVPGDQSATVRRSKPTEGHVKQVENAVHKKPLEVTPPQFPRKLSLKETPGTSNDVSECDPNLPTKVVDNQEQSYLEKSRGKFYNMYVQKRDAKLKEEWSSNRGQKEAKMKAMQDYLESSSAEMKVKFSGSADRPNSSLTAQQRAEKMRYFNNRSAMKTREQHPIGFLRCEEDEDLAEIHEHIQYTEDKFFGGTVPADASSRSVLSKRIGTNKTSLSSASRTSAASLSRSGKPSNSSFERRRIQSENPLAQSVPNFSDLRKENTKPASAVSKVTTRSHYRGVRSKSISEDLPFIKEEKPRRPQLLRKNSTGTSEMDSSSLKSEVTLLKLDKEQTEQSNRVLKNGEMRSFLRKGNGIHPGAGASIAKFKASVTSEKFKSEEDDDDSEDQFEDSVDMIQGEEEESETAMHGELKAVDYAGDSDYEKQGINRQSVKSRDPELVNEELLRSLGPMHPDSVDEVSAAVPSMFHTSVDPVHDSPGESPASWNSRGHHPFFYAQEASDMDTYVESPMGSPASWNSHSLTQMEAEAARMRKKWGSAQKTILLSNTSNNQTRKDVTKGFKRLLKFGRKSRGTESLVDWISATTSEGDDDTEDGCDLANRSSDDLRKSRMGFSQDGFNDGELFNEQVHALRSSIPTPPANFKLREEHLSGSSLKAPRSFFSLSSFRSKGSESKPR